MQIILVYFAEPSSSENTEPSEKKLSLSDNQDNPAALKKMVLQLRKEMDQIVKDRNSIKVSYLFYIYDFMCVEKK